MNFLFATIVEKLKHRILGGKHTSIENAEGIPKGTEKDVLDEIKSD